MNVVPNFSASQVISEGQRTELLIRSILAGVRTAIPVKVLAVHPGAGSPPAIGTVDVQPLVQSVGGSRAWSLKPNYGVPFCRIQSGATAIVADPQVDDIGIAVACDRDISKVLATGGGLSMPGSARKHNLSDLVYVLSIISAAEITQYILANSNGITLLSPNTITIQGGQINLVGPVNANGATISGTGEVTDAAGVVLGTHDHEPGTYIAGSTPVTGTSGAPIP
jgi:hypothetical protein